MVEMCSEIEGLCLNSNITGAAIYVRGARRNTDSQLVRRGGEKTRQKLLTELRKTCSRTTMRQCKHWPSSANLKNVFYMFSNLASPTGRPVYMALNKVGFLGVLDCKRNKRNILGTD